MPYEVFPALPGLTWDLTLTPSMSTNVQKALSGRVTLIPLQQYPLHKFALTYSKLDDLTPNEDGYTELEVLLGFFQRHLGQATPFLLDLSTITQAEKHGHADNQPFGVGDGVTVSFQLVWNWGGSSVLIQPSNQVADVFVNGGTPKTPTTDYTITNGVVTFSSAPAVAAVLTASFDFYLLCRFDADELEFAEPFFLVAEVKQLNLVTVKL